MTRPLSQVTRCGLKEKLFWSESQHNTFFELKQQLSSKSVLKLQDPQQPFEIETYASN